MIERVIISGGGTGGHIFPAVAIANELTRRNPAIKILFVGALGKMEMEKVPEAGYEIVGLPIAGLQRKLTFSNFLLPFKLINSLLKARKIIKDFRPQVVVGVGGYASGPTLQAATRLNIPTLVQEQNSFPGKTNKFLSKKVTALCTAYEGLEQFFPKEKITLTGNPVRSEMVDIAGKRSAAFEHYHFDPSKKTLLIIGGSLGARTLNQAMQHHSYLLNENDIQVLWQCGKLYYDHLKSDLTAKDIKGIKLVKFIDRMDLAYSLADVIISRAGAISVSELCLIQKPVILVPSPNVAEDHQTKNANALVTKNAALMVKDIDAKETLIPQAIDLLMNPVKQHQLTYEIAKLGKPHATASIADVLERIAGGK